MLPLYPGLPILTNFLMSTLGFSGAGWGGASFASLAALRALNNASEIKYLTVHMDSFDCCHAKRALRGVNWFCF